MRTLAALSCVAVLLPAIVSAQPYPVDAKAAVSRLLEAVRENDPALYAEVGAKLFIMAAPDFGVPVSFDEARELFGQCALTYLSDAKPLASIKSSIVAATMTCGAPLPAGPVTFDFLADSKLVHAIYPGGFARFYPNAPKLPVPTPQE